MLAHLLSQLGFALPCVASFECDLGEEEGEFELNLGGGGGGGVGGLLLFGWLGVGHKMAYRHNFTCHYFGFRF